MNFKLNCNYIAINACVIFLTSFSRSLILRICYCFKVAFLNNFFSSKACHHHQMKVYRQHSQEDNDCRPTFRTLQIFIDFTGAIWLMRETWSVMFWSILKRPNWNFNFFKQFPSLLCGTSVRLQLCSTDLWLNIYHWHSFWFV